MKETHQAVEELPGDAQGTDPSKEEIAEQQETDEKGCYLHDLPKKNCAKCQRKKIQRIE